MTQRDLEEWGVTTNRAPAVRYGFSLATHTYAPMIRVLLPSTVGEYLALDARTAKWVFAAIKKLERLGGLRRGWDSYDGLPLSSQAKQVTFDMLDCLKTKDLPVPNIALTSNGTVQLEWRSSGRELEVALGDGGMLEYAKIDSHGHIQGGEEDLEIKVRLNTLTEWLLNG